MDDRFPLLEFSAFLASKKNELENHIVLCEEEVRKVLMSKLRSGMDEFLKADRPIKQDAAVFKLCKEDDGILGLLALSLIKAENDPKQFIDLFEVCVLQGMVANSSGEAQKIAEQDLQTKLAEMKKAAEEKKIAVENRFKPTTDKRKSAADKQKFADSSKKDEPHKVAAVAQKTEEEIKQLKEERKKQAEKKIAEQRKRDAMNKKRTAFTNDWAAFLGKFKKKILDSDQSVVKLFQYKANCKENLGLLTRLGDTLHGFKRGLHDTYRNLYYSSRTVAYLLSGGQGKYFDHTKEEVPAQHISTGMYPEMERDFGTINGEPDGARHFLKAKSFVSPLHGLQMAIGNIMEEMRGLQDKFAADELQSSDRQLFAKSGLQFSMLVEIDLFHEEMNRAVDCFGEVQADIKLHIDMFMRGMYDRKDRNVIKSKEDQVRFIKERKLLIEYFAKGYRDLDHDPSGLDLQRADRNVKRFLDEMNAVKDEIKKQILEKLASAAFALEVRETIEQKIEQEMQQAKLAVLSEQETFLARCPLSIKKLKKLKDDKSKALVQQYDDMQERHALIQESFEKRREKASIEAECQKELERCKHEKEVEKRVLKKLSEILANSKEKCKWKDKDKAKEKDEDSDKEKELEEERERENKLVERLRAAAIKLFIAPTLANYLREDFYPLIFAAEFANIGIESLKHFEKYFNPNGSKKVIEIPRDSSEVSDLQGEEESPGLEWDSSAIDVCEFDASDQASVAVVAATSPKSGTDYFLEKNYRRLLEIRDQILKKDSLGRNMLFKVNRFEQLPNIEEGNSSIFDFTDSQIFECRVGGDKVDWIGLAVSQFSKITNKESLKEAMVIFIENYYDSSEYRKLRDEARRHIEIFQYFTKCFGEYRSTLPANSAVKLFSVCEHFIKTDPDVVKLRAKGIYRKYVATHGLQTQNYFWRFFNQLPRDIGKYLDIINQFPVPLNRAIIKSFQEASKISVIVLSYLVPDELQALFNREAEILKIENLNRKPEDTEAETKRLKDGPQITGGTEEYFEVLGLGSDKDKDKDKARAHIKEQQETLLLHPPILMESDQQCLDQNGFASTHTVLSVEIFESMYHSGIGADSIMNKEKLTLLVQNHNRRAGKTGTGVDASHDAHMKLFEEQTKTVLHQYASFSRSGMVLSMVDFEIGVRQHQQMQAVELEARSEVVPAPASQRRSESQNELRTFR